MGFEGRSLSIATEIFEHGSVSRTGKMPMLTYWRTIGALLASIK
jgi:hypothetical protein